MRRIGGKYDDLLSYELAVECFYDGIRHKKNHPSVRDLYYDRYKDLPPELLGDRVENLIDPIKLRNFLEGILKDLLTDSYVHGSPRYKHLWCTSQSKGPKGKWRDIYAPTLRDHIYHHMIMKVSMEAFTRGMYRWCVGNVPGRGGKDLIDAVTDWCRNDKQWRYFVVLDIRNFFNSIQLNSIQRKLKKKIKDERLLREHNKILNSGPVPVVVGYYTSPWYGNLLLEDFDHYVMECMYKERRGKRIPYVRHFIRYVDDMLLMGSSKRDLEKAVSMIQDYLFKEFEFKLKTTWEIKRIAEYDDNGKLVKGTYRIDYVGYKFDRTRTILRDGNYLSTNRLAHRMNKKLTRDGSVSLKECQSLCSKTGFSAHTDNTHFIQAINQEFSLDMAKEVISNAAKCGIHRASSPVQIGAT